MQWSWMILSNTIFLSIDVSILYIEYPIIVNNGLKYNKSNLVYRTKIKNNKTIKEIASVITVRLKGKRGII